ncbi:MAG: putative DNA binding domain-containing protein [Bacteroidetes bacterium]|nr:putative DNA binding domain-containing protein [Bacteroidota bacterium]
MLTIKNIPALVKQLCSHNQETEWFEFKANYADPKILGQNISAIANSCAISGKSCGYIIWGIQDDSHQIIGTKFNPDSKRVNKEDLPHWLSSRLDPPINFSFHKDTVDGKPVVVLLIPCALSGPVRFNNEAYIRVGSHTTKLNRFREKESLLWQLSNSRNFESGIAIESIQESDIFEILDIESYFSLQNIPLSQNKSYIIQTLQQEKLISQCDDGSWNITNLGFMSFARNLAQIYLLSRKSIRVVKYSGNARYNGNRQEELQVGYTSGFSRVMEVINYLSPTDENFNNGVRKQNLRFPINAVREAVANALIHQDFTEPGTGPIIEIFENRIEILNLGAPLINSKQFINAPPQTRNQAMAALFRRCGICEELGSGWDKIVYETEIQQLPPPLITVTPQSTKVSIFGAKSLSDMNYKDRIQAVYLHASLRFVTQQNGISHTTVQKRFGIDSTNSFLVSQFISEALESGEIIPLNPNADRESMQYIPYWAGISENGE